jgi:GNAT superfamily N-acetyltransferase
MPERHLPVAQLSPATGDSSDMTTAPARAPSFTMPAGLSQQGYRFRPETEADLPFLRRLYISTRWEELAVVDWTEAQKIAFLEQQFAAQRHHYLAYYADSVFDVLEAPGGPAGRLYLQRLPTLLLIVDIALLPEWRGRGIGTAVVEEIFAEARPHGKAVEIAVEKFNPAQRLYLRLGFRQYSEDGPYLFMRWQPQADSPEALS